MNKDEILKRLESLQIQVDLIVKEIQRVPSGRVTCGETYYYINEGITLTECTETNSIDDDARFQIGNYFRTTDSLVVYVSRKKMKQTLIRLAEQLNGKEIDWSKEEPKYFIEYDYKQKSLITHFTRTARQVGQVYCLHPEFIHKAISQIGLSQLEDLVKSGV